MAARTIKFEGKTYQFPDDATEQEIGEALASVHDQGPPANVTSDPRMENPLTDSRISPPESGVGGFLNRKLASVKTALGGNKPERGSGSAAVDLVGGPAIGPLHVAHGVTQMPRHPVQGFNEAVGGVAQTAALPLAVAAPAAIPMSMPYVGGAKAGAWGLTEAGMDPDNAEALSNLVTMGVAGRGSLIRGTGKVLEKVGGASDIPELPFPSRTGAAARMFNAVKRPIGQAGRKMANYGVPQAPNVYDGNASGPLPGEPDLPTPVKPDGMDHHNDVTDHGELDKLLDQVSQQPEVRQGRDPVQADRMPHHNDQSHIDMTPPREPNVQSQSPSEDMEGMAQRQGIDLSQTTPVKGANELSEDPTANIPTPNSDTLLRAIKSAPGWPENGLPNDTPLPPKGLLPPPSQNRVSRGNVLGEDLYTELPNVTPQTPIDLYHGTPDASRVSSIMDKGILSYDDLQKEGIDVGDTINFDTSKVYGTTNPQVAEDYAGRGGEDGPGAQGAIFRARIPLKNIDSDFGEDFTTKSIPPSLIRGVKIFDEQGNLVSDQYRNEGAGRRERVSSGSYGGPPVRPDDISHILDTDPYNRVDEIKASQPKRRASDRPFRRSTDVVGSAQGAADDTSDFQQAKSNLGPDASVSEIAQEAQRLKLKRTGGK